jgi:hypothetical protein
MAISAVKKTFSSSTVSKQQKNTVEYYSLLLTECALGNITVIKLNFCSVEDGCFLGLV